MRSLPYISFFSGFWANNQQIDGLRVLQRTTKDHATSNPGQNRSSMSFWHAERDERVNDQVGDGGCTPIENSEQNRRQEGIGPAGSSFTLLKVLFVGRQSHCELGTDVVVWFVFFFFETINKKRSRFRQISSFGSKRS